LVGVAESPKVSAGEGVKGTMAKLSSIPRDESQAVEAFADNYYKLFVVCGIKITR
jgi:hypothetical protein